MRLKSIRAWAFGFQIAFSLAVVTMPQAAWADLSFSSAKGTPGKLEILVIDEETKAPLAGADVKLSDANQFLKKEIKTTAAGTAQFVLNWSAREKNIHVSKAGYAGVSILGFKSWNVKISLQAQNPIKEVFHLQGNLRGWDDSSDGDYVHGGAILPALSAAALPDFDAFALLSKEMDSFKLFGNHNIPANSMIPDQRFFGLIHLNKETYRLSVSPGATNSTIAVFQGAIPNRSLFKAFQSGHGFSYDLINQFSISKIGFRQGVELDHDLRLDFETPTELKTMHAMRITPPPFKSHVFAIAVTDLGLERQEWIPTDIKMMINQDHFDHVENVSLKSGNFGYEHGVISLAQTPDRRQVSLIITAPAPAEVHPGEFLKPVDLTGYQTALPKTVSVSAPKNGLSVAVFKSKTSPNEKAITWTVYSLSPRAEFNLADLANGGTTQEFEQTLLEFSPDFDEGNLDGHTIVKSISRVARSSVTLKP